MYRPATLFHPSFLSNMVKSNELPLPSGQEQVVMRSSVCEMDNVKLRGRATFGASLSNAMLAVFLQHILHCLCIL